MIRILEILAWNLNGVQSLHQMVEQIHFYHFNTRYSDPHCTTHISEYQTFLAWQKRIIHTILCTKEFSLGRFAKNDFLYMKYYKMRKLIIGIFNGSTGIVPTLV